MLYGRGARLHPNGSARACWLYYTILYYNTIQKYHDAMLLYYYCHILYYTITNTTSPAPGASGRRCIRVPIKYFLTTITPLYQTTVLLYSTLLAISHYIPLLTIPLYSTHYTCQGTRELLSIRTQLAPRLAALQYYCTILTRLHYTALHHTTIPDPPHRPRALGRCCSSSHTHRTSPC